MHFEDFEEIYLKAKTKSDEYFIAICVIGSSAELSKVS